MATIAKALGRAAELHRCGRLDEAEAIYRQVLAADPGSADAWHLWGLVAKARGDSQAAAERMGRAIARFERAAAAEPGNAHAHYKLASALEDASRAAEAAASYRRAIQCNPAVAEAHFNLGALYQRQGRAAAAIECYQNAVRARPDYAAAYINLGTLYKLADPERAAACYAKALESQPDSPEALNNLGNVLKMQGRLAEAAVCYQRVLQVQPENGQARYNHALLLLAEGRYAEGWKEYEFRFACPEFRKRTFDVPRWQAEPLAGRTLLIHAEQGLGDTLQFVRFVPLLARFGGSIVLEVQPALIPLLKGSGLAKTARLAGTGESAGAFDMHVPLASLPGILGTTLDTIPSAEGYLEADAQLVEHWRGVLGDDGRMRLGVAWQGSATYLGDRFRSIPLVEFAPLALDGVELISLQKGFGVEQLAGLGGRFAVRALGEDFDASRGAFVDTAAVMKNLDLVITSDTATAHLAGALGVRVWVALTLVPDWRWMLARGDSPWYASMRLYRQQRQGDWGEVFHRMAAALVDESNRA